MPVKFDNKTIDNIELLPDLIKFFPHFLKSFIEIKLDQFFHRMVNKTSIIVFELTGLFLHDLGNEYF